MNFCKASFGCNVSRVLLLLAVSALSSLTSHAQTESPRRMNPYQLESLEIVGSNRLSPKMMIERLDLKVGMPLNDAVVMNTRQRILSLGLFRSVVLLMRKGSVKGKARLIIEVEDDPSVLGNWALGGEIGVTHGEAQAASVDPESPPLGYKLRLVSRNLFQNLYRGDMFIDLDSNGDIRSSRVAIGMPRFASEDAQFDVELSAVDITRRYLDASLFANHIRTSWTTQAGNNAEVQYGVSVLANRKDRFGFPNFPDLLTGPRLGYTKESRLQRFFPSAGSRTHVAAMYVPMQPNHSTFELGGSRTWNTWGASWLSFNLDTMTIGQFGNGARMETRWDWALESSRSADDQAAFFISLKAGIDRYKDQSFRGSAGLLGIRYHSSGFIAEIRLQITKSPKEFLEEDFPGLREGDL